MASSSSPPKEDEEAPLQHPLEIDLKSGPKTAYELTQLENGLLIRVDMPGVSSADKVKVTKYSENCKVTFSATAEKQSNWMESIRVYGGYVLLNCDPTFINVDKSLKNGCLKLFFPAAQGTLHFIASNKNKAEGNVVGVTSHNDRFHQPRVTIDAVTGVKPHKSNCPCCKGTASDFETKTCAEKDSHINPFIIQGAKGVYEQKFQQNVNGVQWGMYLRIDMPGYDNDQIDRSSRKDACIVGARVCKKEHPPPPPGDYPCVGNGHDGRKYVCVVRMQCKCCKFVNDKYDYRGGVLRMWFDILSAHKSNRSSQK